MKRPRLFPCILAVLLVCTLVLSIPTIEAHAETTDSTNNRYNVVILLDASGSMRDTDPQGYRYEAISQFTSLLAEQGNVLGGVVFHSDVAAEQVPTHISNQAGKDAVTAMLESIPSNRGWTNTGAGLARAVEMAVSNGDPDLPSVILFISDGNTEMATAEETQASLDQKNAAIQVAQEHGVVIYTVCLNADQSADISEMQQASDATGGVFQEVAKAEDLQAVFNTFYNLIYGTSTITLVDEVFPDSGQLETTFDVPGIGVEEVNIVIYGNTSKKSLVRPDGTLSEVTSVDSDTFSMLKLTEIVPGSWTLITEGVPGDSIKINMVYNTDLEIDVTTNPAGQEVNSTDLVTIMATLRGNGTTASSVEQYVGYTAQLQILDAQGELLESIPMEVVNDHFEVKRTFEDGTYYYKVLVTGNHLEKESDRIGPLTSVTVIVEEPTEPAPVNTSPTPVEEVVEENVYIWPFIGGGYTLDLNTLATDEQDDTLQYTVVSSTFTKGTDYTVDTNGILSMEQFSVDQGSFTIKATDSGGLSCEIEVIITVHNVGVMTLIGIGVLVLIGAVILGVILYRTMTKPFLGTISAQSYCNGFYKGTPRSPKRGRETLAVFGMDNVGLDYQKCYFQATGQNYIYLVTNQPVIWNGQKTTKVRIQSGVEVKIAIRESDSRMLYIRFDSRINGAPARPAAHSGHRPTTPPRRR